MANVDDPSAGAHRRPRERLVLAVAFGIVVLGAFHAIRHVTPRVGDGSEYYALYFAWTTTGLPYETETSWRAYESLAEREPALALVRRRELTFPALVQNATEDFNHAPFYSGLAALVGCALSSASIHLHPRTAFIVLHAMLTLGLLAIGWSRRGLVGVGAIAALVLTSPLVWFFDKVHTEYFTFCATTAAIAFVADGDFAYASSFLGLASIQNPIFGGCAALAAVLSLVREKGTRRSPRKLAAIGTAGILSALYPGYYLVRIHHISPQWVAGGARLFAQAGHPLAFFFDPDIGLLPNWPFGVVLIGYAIANARPDRIAAARSTIAFATGFVALCLFAQVATENLNSGGTRDVSRYSLWYVCLGFPVAVSLLERARGHRVVAGIAGAAFVATNAYLNDPSLGERYIASTRFSRALESHAPRLYDPPIEVFAERYSTYGEQVFAHRPLVVVGPRCRKLLVLHGNGADPAISSRASCELDPARVFRFVEAHGGFAGSDADDEYLVPSDEELRSLGIRNR